MGWLVDPYRSSEFLRLALIGAVIVGVLAPVVGVWIVLRRLSYLGDAMSHATLGGVAFAQLVGISLTAGAMGAGVIMGGAIAVLSGRRRVGRDAAIGVIETVLFAVGVVIISMGPGSAIDLSHYLFGQLLTVSRGELVVNAVLAVVALAVIVARFADLRAATFDPLHARQVGISTTALDHLLLALVSVTVVVSLQTVGLLMSVAMLVTPAATARLVVERVTTMTVVAVGFGVVAAVGGLTASYHLGSSPGATIALVAAGQFVVVLVVREVVSGGARLRSRSAQLLR
jgi:ABC-type Mn2+/Zn2+ transport system permease subunit